MEVVVKNISKKFDNKIILKKVSFEIKNNDFIHLKGKNGAGKTTLLKIIKGVMTPDSGEIIKKNPKIELITNNQRSFFLRLNTIDNLIFFSGLSGSFDKTNLLKKIKHYLNYFDLEKKSHLKMINLSSGEIKKALIIRALIREPDLMLMDEIFTNLDLESKEKIIQFIKDIYIKKGKSIIWVSHDSSIIDNLITRTHNLYT